MSFNGVTLDLFMIHVILTTRDKDQLQECIQLIQSLWWQDYWSAWNPLDLSTMMLSPCHLLCQFYVSYDETIDRKRLSTIRRYGCWFQWFKLCLMVCINRTCCWYEAIWVYVIEVILNEQGDPDHFHDYALPRLWCQLMGLQEVI